MTAQNVTRRGFLTAAGGLVASTAVQYVVGGNFMFSWAGSDVHVMVADQILFHSRKKEK